MIASVAGFNPSEIQRVGRESYALTLWAFLHMQDSRHIASLNTERDSIDLASMIAVGFVDPKNLRPFETNWKARATRPILIGQNTQEAMSQRADELWGQHELAMLRRRPVS